MAKRFFLTKIYFAQKEILPPKNFANKKFDNKKFSPKKIFSLKIKLLKKICQEKILSQKCIAKKNLTKFFFFFKFYFLAQRAKIFGIKVFLGPTFFRKRILRINFFWNQITFSSSALTQFFTSHKVYFS